MVDVRDPDWLEQARRFISDGLDDIQSRVFGSKNPAEIDQLILMVLADAPATAFTISESTGLGSSSVYPALYKLERAGRVVSAWLDSPHPRSRVYRLSEAEYAAQTMLTRNLTTHPHTPDEQRILNFLGDKGTSQEAVNDPISFLCQKFTLTWNADAPPTAPPDAKPI